MSLSSEKLIPTTERVLKTVMKVQILVIFYLFDLLPDILEEQPARRLFLCKQCVNLQLHRAPVHRATRRCFRRCSSIRLLFRFR